MNESQARHNLQALLDKYRKLTESDRKSISEEGVVNQFIVPLLADVLGWHIQDPQRFKYELHTVAGRPDMILLPEQGGVVFVEAKRFGVIKELEESRRQISGVLTPGQLSLPGMATDRTPEEQQAINYAFQNGGTWAILTNFERLRLFNARRDWLVLSFERPDAYLTEFDQLTQLSYENILNGTLDRLSNQRWTRDIDTQYLAFINEWRQRLAENIIQRRAQNHWAFHNDGSINLPLLRAVVQRFLDRLVLVRFAEDHLVIPPGTLFNFYEVARTNIYFSLGQTISTFFRRFDENHNSALFAPGPVDQVTLDDDVLLPLVGRLYDARYRSMPADIMGNTYEQYLGKALVLQNGSVTTRDNLETRKKQGSYYTPQVIVQYIVDHSLGRWLYGTENGKPDGDPIPGETRKISRDLADLRVLDSACGSGSFLIYAYQVLAEFYESEMGRLKHEYERMIADMAAHFEAITTEERIAVKVVENEAERLKDYPRIILEQHIYGTDLDPQAAEIAVVNLMMRAMERRAQDKRLPLILNQNIKVGNSLVGIRPDDPRLTEHAPTLAQLIALRRELLGTANTDPRHDVILSELETITTTLNDTLNTAFTNYFTDLDRVRPFHWGIEFPEAFYNNEGTPKETPGFTIIIGNPPWEVVMPDEREFYAQFDERIESKLQGKKADERITELNAEDPKRVETWMSQKHLIEQYEAYFGKSSDYFHQYRGHVATHKLFIERMYVLMRDKGHIGYVVPSGIYKDLGTKALREMILDQGSIEYIYSFSNVKSFFPGVNDRVQFALVGAQKGVQREGFWAAFRFNPRVAVAPSELPTFLSDKNNLIYMHRESLKRFNPDSVSVMEFQTSQDYETAEKIYSSHPLMNEELKNIWNIQLSQEFNVTAHQHYFNENTNGFPLYEGKMIHQYNAFYGSPKYWIDESKIASLPSQKQLQLRSYRIAHRRIARPTDERTLIAAVVPPNTACEVNATVVLVNDTEDEQVKLYLCAILNSLTIDYVLRFKVASTLNMFYLQQLPIPRLTAGDPYFDAIVPRAARLVCVHPVFIPLWEQVMGQTPPLEALTPEARQQLRDEIDALVAHLYGLSREDFAHILSTFPLVFPDTDAGRARKEALLHTYDTIQG